MIDDEGYSEDGSYGDWRETDLAPPLPPEEIRWRQCSSRLQVVSWPWPIVEVVPWGNAMPDEGLVLDGYTRVYNRAMAGTWSNLTTAPPLTPEAFRQACRWYQEAALRPPQPQVFFSHSPTEMLAEDQEFTQGLDALHLTAPWDWRDEQADHVTQELLDLVAAGDEAGFRALAGCVMPAEDVEPCWHGARARLGLGLGDG